MNNAFKRTVSVLVAAVFIISALISCSNSADENNTTGNSEISLAETEPAGDNFDNRLNVKDTVPEYNFNGYKFRILANNDCVNNYIAEENTGDVINDAVFRRNTNICERFNIEIAELDAGMHRDAGVLIEKLVTAGDDCCELFSGHAIVTGGNVTHNLFVNWYDIPNINFDMPWWNRDTVKEITINNVMLLTPSLMSLSTYASATSTYYNKKIADNYNLPNIYDIVNKGEWTIDCLLDTIKGVYSDLNGNGICDDDDQYGMSCSTFSEMDIFETSLNMPNVTIDGDYNISIDFACDKNMGIVEKLYDLCTNNTDCYGITKANVYDIDVNTMFTRGNTMIVMSTVGNSASTYRDFEDDYAIIPNAKYDEKQEGYYTLLGGGHAAFCVPKSTVRTEMTGAIFEAMTAESWKIVSPAYYDVTLKLKGTRDEESMEMLDLIISSAKVNFYYLYDNWEGFSFALQQMFYDYNTNLASFVASKERSVYNHYESVIDAFVNYYDN